MATSSVASSTNECIICFEDMDSSKYKITAERADAKCAALLSAAINGFLGDIPVKEETGLKALQCFHIFHRHCIEEWFKKNNRCPLCNNIHKKGEWKTYAKTFNNGAHPHQEIVQPILMPQPLLQSTLLPNPFGASQYPTGTANNPIILDGLDGNIDLEDEQPLPDVPMEDELVPEVTQGEPTEEMLPEPSENLGALNTWEAFEQLVEGWGVPRDLFGMPIESDQGYQTDFDIPLDWQ